MTYLDVLFRKTMKLVLITIITCGFILSSPQIFAQELPLPEGKNIREWEAISVALVAEDRFDEAIVYLDKILEKEPTNLKAMSNKAGLLIQLERFSESLELSNQVLSIEPNRVSTLINKALALQNMKKFDDAYLTFIEILDIQPDNKDVSKAAGKLLSTIPTINSSQSEYEIHVQMVIRDKDGNLFATTESKNARVLPSVVTERYWDWLKSNGYVQTTQTGEVFTKSVKLNPFVDHVSFVTFDGEFGGYTITFFEAFVPMIPIKSDDKASVTWTIIKT